jgi:hypothetical protein
MANITLELRSVLVRSGVTIIQPIEGTGCQNVLQELLHLNDVQVDLVEQAQQRHVTVYKNFVTLVCSVLDRIVIPACQHCQGDEASQGSNRRRQCDCQKPYK